MTKITAKSGTSTQTMCIGNDKIKHVDNINIIELCKKHGAEVYRPDDMGDDITFQYDQLAGLLDELRAQVRREVLEEVKQKFYEYLSSYSDELFISTALGLIEEVSK